MTAAFALGFAAVLNRNELDSAELARLIEARLK
jgi:hypothetical protein